MLHGAATKHISEHEAHKIMCGVLIMNNILPNNIVYQYTAPYIRVN